MARVLWIDLCVLPAREALYGCAAGVHHLIQVSDVAVVARAIRQFAPASVCVEFDYPDAHRLQVVTRIRRTSPALPLLMFTEYHSEALGLWAFRSGVWDYRVKPVERDVLLRCIDVAAHAAGSPPNGCRTSLPDDLIEPAGHLVRPPTASPRTGPAIAYLTQHYDEDVPRKVLAALCHLSASEFSRAFRRENGVTVDDYLLDYRLAKARNFLAEPGASVSGTAYAVGFNDPSYFCRVFHRRVGMTAGHYQKQVALQSTSGSGENPVQPAAAASADAGSRARARGRS